MVSAHARARAQARAGGRHTILLVQLNSMVQSRTYFDFENESLACDGARARATVAAVLPAAPLVFVFCAPLPLLLLLLLLLLRARAHERHA
jgi:hypothetical protein